MCDSRSAPKIFISHRLLYSDTRVTFRTQLFPLIRFLSLWNGRHILFHSETKYTSYTPTTPFLSFKIIHFEAYKYLFHNLSDLLVYFIDFGMCVVNPNYTLPIPCFSLWSERHVFSHGITSFSFVFYLFGVSYVLKYHSSSRPFLLLLIAFRYSSLIVYFHSVYLHSETKDISYTQTIPFLSLNLGVNVR